MSEEKKLHDVTLEKVTGGGTPEEIQAWGDFFGDFHNANCRSCTRWPDDCPYYGSNIMEYIYYRYSGSDGKCTERFAK